MQISKLLGVADPPSEHLLPLLLEAHAKAAQNTSPGGIPCGSTMAARIAAQGSGSMVQALCAGLLATGDKHAPLEAVRALLDDEDPSAAAWALVRSGKPVPGFGNSFYKNGQIDSAFDLVWEALMELAKKRDPHLRPAWDAMLAMHTALPQMTGDKLAPNAAMMTALVCRACNLPAGMEVVLFLLGRAGIWAREYFDTKGVEP
jgi:citrate synthase